jgi:hypothetical protein
MTNYEGEWKIYSFKGTQQPMQNMGVPYLAWPSFDHLTQVIVDTWL